MKGLIEIVSSTWKFAAAFPVAVYLFANALNGYDLIRKKMISSHPLNGAINIHAYNTFVSAERPPEN